MFKRLFVVGQSSLLVILLLLASLITAVLSNQWRSNELPQTLQDATDELASPSGHTDDNGHRHLFTPVVTATPNLATFNYQPVVLTELSWEIIVAVIFGSMAGSCILTLIVYCACGRPEEGHLI